jgi:regulatory protein
LDALARERLQSDERFAEAYVRSRSERGFGPVRIRAELRERGVESGLIETALEAAEMDWDASAGQEREKRFGPQLPQAWPERARQARFLEGRGFPAAIVGRVLDL